MDAHLIINSDHAGFFYALFYVLAVLCGFLLLIREGYRRGFNMIPWMIIIATAFLFFIAGCKIINFTENDWQRFLHVGSIPYGTSRSVLGGILFAIPGIWLAQKWLRFDHRVMDAFAFVLPASIAIERIGCLLVGCCYGSPSDLPWAIQYGPGFHAFIDQAQAGILPAASSLSLPVHPVQLYEVAGSLFIILVLRNISKHIHRAGNFFLTSVCLYGGLRFLLQFVRGSHGEGAGINLLWGLSRLQWMLLAIVPLLVAIILIRESHVQASVSTDYRSGSRIRKVAFLFFIGLIFLFVIRWLDILELISLGIVWLPLTMMLAGYLFTRATVPQFRVASIVLPVTSLFLMNQTIPERANNGTRVSYNTVSTGAMSGNANLTDSYSVTHSSGGGGDCYGDGAPYTYYSTTTSTKSDNTFRSAALGISRTVQVSKNEFITFGVNGFSGSHHELFDQTISTTQSGTNNVHVSKNNQFSYSGIKPYFQYDHTNWGFGLGLMIGEMRRFGTPQYDYDGYWRVTSTTLKMDPVVPSAYLRVGNLSKFFIDFGVNSQFTPAYPTLTYQGSVGIGIGKGVLKIGSGPYAGIFLASIIPVGKHFVIEPFIGGGGGGKYKTAESTVGSLNVHYKFNRKERVIH